MDVLLGTGDLVEKLKFLPRLPHTQGAAIICADEVCYTLLKAEITQVAHRGVAVDTCMSRDRTWLPEHSDARSVMASWCSSSTSDRVMLLPLLGMSNTNSAPDETPAKPDPTKVSLAAHLDPPSPPGHTYPHIYSSPTLPIPPGQTQPELGHKSKEYWRDSGEGGAGGGTEKGSTCRCLGTVQCVPVHHDGTVGLIHLQTGKRRRR